MILSSPLKRTKSVLWQHILNRCACVYMKALMMDPLWPKTCWSTFKYFIIFIISTYYILCISWIIKCLIHSTCYGCQPHPSLGVHKTVTTASGTGHIFCAATFLQRDHASLATLEEGSCTVWPVTEAVVTVLCTPDDGCGWHPEHVEWTCRIINRLLCGASRWAVINIDQRCTEP